MVFRRVAIRTALLLSAASGAVLAQSPALAQIAGDGDDELTETAAPSEEAIVVTGSRIARAGFDQPTPTTVVGEIELRQGARESLQQALNEQPQIRNTTCSGPE